MELKVLFQNRNNAFTAPGGDTTQMLKTKEGLERLGAEVHISLEAEPELRGFDLVHVFNIQTAKSGLRQILNAKRHGLPVVLSPIYWHNRHIYRNQDFVRYHSSPFVRALAHAHWRIPSFLLMLNRKVGSKAEHKHREMLVQADLLLPNSYAEAEILALEFNAPWARGKSVKVINAIDPSEFIGKDSMDQRRSPEGLPDEYVLAAGRVETIKAQLQVIRSLMSCPEIPIVFLGAEINKFYSKACRELASERGNVFFVAPVPHAQVVDYYRHARVHVLAGLRETTGLVSLEAAACGANCVVGIHAPVMEYFGEGYWYCDPDDCGTIRQAILAAWKSPPNPLLQDRIVKEFTWEAAASQTLGAYRKLLG